MSNHYLRGWGDSDYSFTDRSGDLSPLKRRFSDFSESFDHQKEINGYKEREQQLSAVVESQLTILKALKKEVKELGSAKEEYQKKEKILKIEVENYTKLMDAKLKDKEVEKIAAIKSTEDKFKQQIEDKQNIIDGMKSFIEVNRSLREENSALNQKIKEKDIQLQGMGNRLHIIEQLRDENAVKTLRANEYKVKYETLKTERDSNLKKLKSENTKYKNEITSLKRQKEYYQNNNENNKRKSVAISHTQIRQKEIYSDACKQFGQNGLESIKKICEKMVKLLAQVEKEETSEMLENLENIVTDLKEKNNTIEEQEKIILEKRSDGKVACGECGYTFNNTGNLSRHMTLKHFFRRPDNFQFVTIEGD